MQLYHYKGPDSCTQCSDVGSEGGKERGVVFGISLSLQQNEAGPTGKLARESTQIAN